MWKLEKNCGASRERVKNVCDSSFHPCATPNFVYCNGRHKGATIITEIPGILKSLFQEFLPNISINLRHQRFSLTFFFLLYHESQRTQHDNSIEILNKASPVTHPPTWKHVNDSFPTCAQNQIRIFPFFTQRNFRQLLVGLCCGRIMKMENSSTPMPRFNKCCFFFGLRSGVLIFVSIEALFWSLMSFVAVYSEVKYINNINLLDFTDDLERDWYYYMIFEHPRDTFTERVRSKTNRNSQTVH